MAEPDISPLAKSLAEQNAIDWRLLPGSGPGGRITERDIFVYLAERHAREDSGSQTFDEELILVADDAESFDAGILDTESFDTGTLDVESLDPRALDTEPYRTRAEEAASEAALILDLGAEEEAGPVSDTASTDLDWSTLRFDDPTTDEHAQDHQTQDHQTEHPAFHEGEREKGRGAEAFGFGAYGAAAPSSAGAEPEQAKAGYLDATPAGTSDANGPSTDRLDLGTLEKDSLELRNLDLGNLDLDSLDMDLLDMDGLDTDSLDRVRLDVRHPNADGPEADGARTGARPDRERQDAAEADDFDELDFDRLELGGSSLDHRADGTDRADAVPEVTPPGTTPPEAAPFSLEALPRMERGLLLRNHLALAPLLEIEETAARALGREARAVRAALLLRAAARALERETEEPHVALAVFAEKRVVSVRIAEAARLPFGELVARAGDALTARDRHDEAALLIADLSAYGVDEAILRIDTPSLMLGRVEEGEAARGALSLAGELEPARAAALLARVSDQLEAPIALLL